MKKHLFLFQLFFAANGFAQNTSSEDEFRCLRELRSQMDSRFFYEPAGRNTILYFMRENGQANVGMFDRAHNPTMLVIENDALLVCNMDFDHRGAINFKIEEEAVETLKLTYTKASPHFRDSGWFPPRRPCENALTGSSQTQATDALRNIIKQGLRGYFTSNGAQSLLPANCNGAAGLREEDIQLVRDEVAAIISAPASTAPAGPTSGEVAP